MDLSNFSEWLRGRGLAAGTARLYAAHLSAAFRLSRPEERLLDDRLAPKTRAAARAALRSWALYQNDPEMVKRLGDIKLPKAVRKTPKYPLPRAEWLALIDQIEVSKKIGDPVRAVLGLLATRGLRVGDALRMQRGEVHDALRGGILSFVIKGNKRVEYHVTDNFSRFLDLLEVEAEKRDWKRVEDLVSPRSKGDRRRAAVIQIERLLRVVGEEAGLDGEELYPHRLRRTYAVEYLKQMKGDPEALVNLQQHMQWESLETAAGYVDHPRQEKLLEVERRMFKR
jgi:site-specific recombinase XerD